MGNEDLPSQNANIYFPLRSSGIAFTFVKCFCQVCQTKCICMLTVFYSKCFCEKRLTVYDCTTLLTEYMLKLRLPDVTDHRRKKDRNLCTPKMWLFQLDQVPPCMTLPASSLHFTLHTLHLRAWLQRMKAHPHTNTHPCRAPFSLP